MALNRYVRLAPTAIIVSAHFEEQSVGADVTDNRHALYLGYRHSFRETDDLVLPREGFLGTVEVGGGLPRSPPQRFLRGVRQRLAPARVSAAAAICCCAARPAWCAAETREGIPTTFLFRTGGDQTVRGYAFESLGVRQGDAIVGGRRLAVGSVEYTHWIGESWGLATFVDAGNAWDERHELQSRARLRSRRALPHADRADPRRPRLRRGDQRIQDPLFRRLYLLR